MEKKTLTVTPAARMCRRCKAKYSPSDNTPRSCRFHPFFFVCHRHDNQKRYYDLKDGDPSYAGKFYDCSSILTKLSALPSLLRRAGVTK